MRALIASPIGRALELYFSNRGGFQTEFENKNSIVSFQVLSVFQHTPFQSIKLVTTIVPLATIPES